MHFFFFRFWFCFVSAWLSLLLDLLLSVNECGHFFSLLISFYAFFWWNKKNQSESDIYVFLSPNVRAHHSTAVAILIKKMPEPKSKEMFPISFRCGEFRLFVYLFLLLLFNNALTLQPSDTIPFRSFLSHVRLHWNGNGNEMNIRKFSAVAFGSSFFFLLCLFFFQCWNLFNKIIFDLGWRMGVKATL